MLKLKSYSLFFQREVTVTATLQKCRLFPFIKSMLTQKFATASWMSTVGMNWRRLWIKLNSKKQTTPPVNWYNSILQEEFKVLSIKLLLNKNNKSERFTDNGKSVRIYRIWSEWRDSHPLPFGSECVILFMSLVSPPFANRHEMDDRVRVSQKK